jgi:hypothetical protein
MKKTVNRVDYIAAQNQRITGARASAGALLTLAVILTPGAPLSGQSTSDTGEPATAGNYSIRQVVEFGGRAASFTGNGALYNTFVNLHSGPRLYDESLDMQSLNHNGALFDNLSLSGFGFGGDPNSAARLRLYRNRWYNFSGTFRRDRNLWDYGLLANPLNPAGSSPTVPITTSPHAFQTSRRMTDLGLTLFPQSRVRVRLGYSRSINEGPSLSTIHEGTDTVVFQGWKTTINAYRIGVDFKFIPRTNFSFDEFLTFYKGDTSWVDRNFGYQLSTGQPVDLGIVFNTGATSPCAAPIVNGAANPSCNEYFFYSRSAPLRNRYPTEQVAFQSNYFRNLDFSGRFVYSNAQSVAASLNETFQGVLTRTLQSAFTDSGPAAAHRISATADLAATVHISEKLRFSDSFHYNVFRIPGEWDGKEKSTFGATNTHSTSSPADAISEIFSNFLGQSTAQNDVGIDYDFNRKLSARLGYRYSRRLIDTSAIELLTQTFLAPTAQRGVCAGQAVAADGSCTSAQVLPDGSSTLIHQHTGLLGIAVRPAAGLRVNFDVDLMTADNVFTRISPRHAQHYRLRSRYQPAPWITSGFSVNIMENRNNSAEAGNLQHNRSYALDAALLPGKRWSADFGYQYTDVFSRTNICFTSTPAPAESTVCAASVALLTGLSFYNNTTNYGYVNLQFRPIARIAFTAGYNVTSVDGSTLILNPNSPGGSLVSTFHRPTASAAFDIAKHLIGKAAWGYYDYTEPILPADLTGVRRFRGNLVDFSVRYGF